MPGECEAAVEQAHEADEAGGGTRNPNARCRRLGPQAGNRAHRLAAYARCSADAWRGAAGTDASRRAALTVGVRGQCSAHGHRGRCARTLSAIDSAWHRRRFDGSRSRALRYVARRSRATRADRRVASRTASMPAARDERLRQPQLKRWRADLARHAGSQAWTRVAAVAHRSRDARRRRRRSQDSSGRPTRRIRGVRGVRCGAPPNKRMKLTRLAAAPGTPTQGAAAWARGLGTGPTASQLMRGVRPTWGVTDGAHRRYVHTSIVATDRRSLASATSGEFGCEVVPPERHSAVAIWKPVQAQPGSNRGVMSALPGHGPMASDARGVHLLEGGCQAPALVNRPGFGLIAFEVDSVAQTAARDAGSRAAARWAKSSRRHADVAARHWVHATDPERDCRVQSWSERGRRRTSA